jgi:hypothetical protein
VDFKKGIHHLLWRHSTRWIERVAKGFAYGLKERLGSLASHHGISFSSSPNPPVDMIFLPPSAIHAFKEPYVTMDRAKQASMILKKIMISSGFRVLDTFQMEYNRPEMTKDGVHYNDAMNYMQAQLLLNMLCNNES